MWYFPCSQLVQQFHPLSVFGRVCPHSLNAINSGQGVRDLEWEWWSSWSYFSTMCLSRGLLLTASVAGVASAQSSRWLVYLLFVRPKFWGFFFFFCILLDYALHRINPMIQITLLNFGWASYFSYRYSWASRWTWAWFRLLTTFFFFLTKVTEFIKRKTKCLAKKLKIGIMQIMIIIFSVDYFYKFS